MDAEIQTEIHSAGDIVTARQRGRTLALELGFNGADVTLKKFYRDPGGKIRLQPANAAMQPIFADPEQVQVQGVVVGVMRKY